MDIIGDIIGGVFTALGGWIVEFLKNTISWFLGVLVYLLEVVATKIVGWLYQTFEVLSGIKPVTYRNFPIEFPKLFFDRTTVAGSAISYVYWAFAMIGIALAIAFTIAAVIRKSFDIDSENKQTFSKILINLGKSVLVIFLMSSIISVVLTFSTVLLKSITTAFKESTSEKAQQIPVTYDEEDFAAMTRVMDTIGEYSMNPSYNSRYNLNSCFNDIRADLERLKKKGKFKYPYVLENGDREKMYWQYALQEIVYSAPPEYDVPIDIYNERLSENLMMTMNALKTNKNFKPLSKYIYHVPVSEVAGELDISRVILVIGSLDAAKNDKYNGATQGLFDELRGPYTAGYKDIMDPDQVDVDFDLSLTKWNHVTVILLILFMLYSFLGIGFNCAARVFNMMFLYLILPFAASTLPYDDGAKLKQWTTAFVVQSFSFFGTVIAIQLFTIMLPVIYDNNLVMSTTPILNWFIKSLLIMAFGMSVSRASSILTGILAENAGMEAVRAGDLAGDARGFLASAAGKAWDKLAGGKDKGGKDGNAEKKEESEESDAAVPEESKSASLKNIWKEGFEGGAESETDLSKQKGGSKDDFNVSPKSSLHLDPPDAPDKSGGSDEKLNGSGFYGNSINGDDDEEDEAPSAPAPKKARDDSDLVRHPGGLSAGDIQARMARFNQSSDLPDSNK